MGIIIDIALVALIILSAVLAWRKGLARVLIEVVGYVVALTLAFTLSGIAAPMIYDNFIADTVTNQAENIFTNFEQANQDEPTNFTLLGENENIITLNANPNSSPTLVGGININDIDINDCDFKNIALPQNLTFEDIQTAFENLPENLANIANTFAITPEQVYETYQEQLASGQTSINLATVFADDIISTPAIMVIRIITLVLLMIIFMIIVRFVSKAISKVLFKTPIIGTANRLLGLAFGILRGTIFALLIALALIPILHLATDDAVSIIESSALLRFVQNVID